MLESIAHYKILDRIGAGGMGEVYRARDTRLGRTVAIKVLAPDVAGDRDRRERFLREARASAALSHPNIAALYEIGEDQGQLFLAFEFVPGETLKTVIGERALHPRRAVDFAAQIADALADAHAQGIIHRDIKSDNVIITPKDKAKILDFGLATWTAGGARREHAADATVMTTGAGTTIGTLAYMSPEQALGERVDHRTDIFSLGIVLFEMLTGRLPFGGNTPTAVALQIVQAPVVKPSSFNRAVPPELDAVVTKALAKSLDQRYESAATMAAELFSVAAILDVRTEISESSGPPRAAISVPRSRFPVGWIVLLLVLAVLAALAWSQRETIQRLWRRTLGPAPAPVIAVVPFETDPSQTFFADGLAEDLITRLGQTPGLKVLGRSATRNYRGRTPAEVARELGAGVVLTGSLRPSADSVKITLELIDPADSTAVWSNQYVRDVKDIFAVQAQVANEVAQALRVRLQPTAASARAASRLVDPRAYGLYLRGREAAARRQSAEAIRLFENAIAADSGLAEAHAGLAEALFRRAASAGVTDDEATRVRMQAEVDSALKVDPDLPQMHHAAAVAAATYGSVIEALEHLRSAVAADPSYPDAYHAIGDVIKVLAPERALAFYRASLDLEPQFDASRGDIVRTYVMLGRHDEAVREERAMLQDPVGGRMALAEADLIETGQDTVPPDAKPEAGGYLPMWVRYARALLHVSRKAQARAVLSDVLRLSPAFCEAQVLANNSKPALQAAEAEDASSTALRCAVVAAAAAGDAGRTAALIDRISRHAGAPFWDDAHIGHELATFDRHRNWYPWNRVAADSRVVAAVGRLNEALADIKRQIPEHLPVQPANR